TLTGRLADRFSPVRILTIWLIGLLVNAVLGAVGLATATGPTLVVLGLVWFFVAGIGNGGAAVPQQARLAGMAHESAAIVMALNASAISLGSALGGALGGVTLATGAAPHQLLLVAAVVLTATVLLHAAVVRSARRAEVGVPVG
ncbi:putative MFS family arabinose efflux permease, partial [Friedmanniella endophytica]|nr:putative MFS family arabinose efflux permease [Microlunatus kandeliicorticis]